MPEPTFHLQGLDLKIDPNVQKICEAYNATSGSTRSVLYFLLLVNILSLIAVINSHSFNWTQQRIAALDDSVKHYLTVAPLATDGSSGLQARDRLDQIKLQRDQNIRSKIDNYQTVHVPILGNAFDINNLSVVAGITFILLMTILRFTLSREKNNLRLSLQAITDRYPEGLVEKELQDAAVPLKGNRQELYRHINHTRRKFHYNFLSMNEIFNTPPLEVSDSYLQRTLLARIVSKNLFYFPYFVYLGIIINDLTTIGTGFQTSPIHTSISLALSLLFISIISYLCHQCNIQKVIVHNLFLDFYNNGYQQVKKLPVVTFYTSKDYLLSSVRPFMIIAGYCWRRLKKVRQPVNPKNLSEMPELLQ